MAPLGRGNSSTAVTPRVNGCLSLPLLTGSVRSCAKELCVAVVILWIGGQFPTMRVDAGVHGVLGVACLVGLSLYALGVIDWGARGVALFSLCGFVWLLVVITGVAADQRERPARDRQRDERKRE